jgi:predicted MPP superfamily phosphohydrolase
VLAGYFFLHWALFSLFSGLFPASVVLPAILIMGLSSIACLFLVHWRRNLLTRAYYLLGTSWMGLALISLVVLVPLWLLRRFAGIDVGGYTTLGIIALVALLGIFNAVVPRVRELDLWARKLKRPLRIVQLSDIHVGEINTPSYLRKVVRKTNALKPDVVVITGDLFDGGEHYPGMIAPLAELNAKHRFFVTGNHEVYTGQAECVERISRMGFTVIDERIVSAGGVQFAGMSYAASAGNPGAGALLRRFGAMLDKKMPAVLLRHTPDGGREAAAAGFDLQLSGHTHAGQIWPFTYLVMLVHRSISGLYTSGEFSLYVSPGTGTWGPPFRIGSRSEITLIRLHAAG